MRLSCYQPQYFPRLHYFARALMADTFCFADGVQFVRRHKYPASPSRGGYRDSSFQPLTPIKLRYGVDRLIVPICHEGLVPINRSSIAYDQPWPRQHERRIREGYASAPYFHRIYDPLYVTLVSRYANLADLGIATFLWGLSLLFEEPEVRTNIDLANDYLQCHPYPFKLRRIVRLSSVDVSPTSTDRDATRWLVDNCRALGATEYVCGGTASCTYMNFSRFQQAAIRVVEQRWVCPEYRQQFSGHRFVPNLSIVDLLANVDAATARGILAEQLSMTREVA